MKRLTIIASSTAIITACVCAIYLINAYNDDSKKKEMVGLSSHEATKSSQSSQDDPFACFPRKGANPFSKKADCEPGVPSPAVAAMAGDRPEGELTKGYHYQLAIDVLRAEPEAFLAAYDDRKDCWTLGHVKTSERYEQCRELESVMPRALLGLRVLSSEGNQQAAFDLASYYLFMLQFQGAGKEAWPVYVANFDKYIQAAGAYNAEQISAMQQQISKFRGT